jgi:excisionase family DNA binding protein
MQVEATRLYRVKAVAELLDVSPATVYRAVESGRLGALRFGAGKGGLRIWGEALTAYLAACQVPSFAASVAPVLDGLSDAQADGMACVVCGADYLTVKVAHGPVGRSRTGSQVFACSTHRPVAGRESDAHHTLAAAMSTTREA